MDRTDLELVLCVQQHGSMAAAAQQLGITRSAVTRRLAALEAHLGVRLFQRTTRRVSATAEGDAFCERAQRLQHDFIALETELRERQVEPAGPIRLLSSFGFGRCWVGPALAEFQTDHPAVSVQLQPTACPTWPPRALTQPCGSGMRRHNGQASGWPSAWRPTDVCWWPHPPTCKSMGAPAAWKT